MLPELPWRSREIETGPIRLGARRLYILPTRAGLVYAALLLSLLIGAMNYAVSLAYLFTFWLAALGVVAMLHTQRNLAGLSLRPLPIAPIFAGESARCIMQVDNPGGLQRSRIALSHPTGGLTVADVSAHGQSELSLALLQPRRGWHPVGRLDIHSQAPLGLFRCWSVLRPDWGVLVYPTPSASRRPLPEQTASSGDAVATRRGDEEFSALRSYQPGDPSRRIAWRTLARGGNLMTKQFAGSGGGALWLDWSALTETDTEARLSQLTRWALDAHAAGRRYGLRLPGRQIDPDSGEAQLRRCLEALARHGLD